PPPSIERLMNRALAKLPSDRFANALEMRLVVEQSLSEHGELPTREWIAGAAPPKPARSQVVGAPLQRSRETRSPVWRAVQFYSLALIAFLVGAWLIQRYAGDETPTAQASDSVLPLVPEQAAFFRAVVKPWADVYVDGELVATTPFAHAVALAPGVHYVRF